MEMIEWKDKFSVHVDEMDRHHKKLLGYFAELHDEIAAGETNRKVRETLKSIGEYADFHFSEEERLMKAMSFPELASQINQHAYFISEVEEMSKQFSLGTLPGKSILSFLRDWFINHIMQEDCKYGEMIKHGKPLP